VTNDVGGVGPGIDDMSGVYHDEVGGTCGVMCDVESDLLIPIPFSLHLCEMQKRRPWCVYVCVFVCLCVCVCLCLCVCVCE